MASVKIDPAPRRYAPFVTLLRRSRFDAGGLGPQDGGAVEAWLLADAADETDLLALFQAFVSRLVAAGLPLQRASLHIGTLHPQLFGYAWNWNSDDGYCDEIKVAEEALRTDAYRRNPLYRVIEEGLRYRAPMDDEAALAASPLLAELRANGITDYLALPLHAEGGCHNAATVATKRAGGFTDDQLAKIEKALRLLALHVQKHIALRIAENVVDTYLGAAAGRQVLRGTIKRGSGAGIDAVIWASDLRGFTDLADRLEDRQMIAVLNAYFDCLAGGVLAEGGEVLKFIGDGLLAVFPFARFDSEAGAAAAALAAARSALTRLDSLNEDGTRLSGIAGWRPLRSGIALHRGTAFFGNVGAPERLDFTVIGKAVNAASRVESLSKTLGRPILLTAPVAALLDEPLDDLGAHALRGLSAPLRIFAPRG